MRDVIIRSISNSNSDVFFLAGKQIFFFFSMFIVQILLKLVLLISDFYDGAQIREVLHALVEEIG